MKTSETALKKWGWHANKRMACMINDTLFKQNVMIGSAVVVDPRCNAVLGISSKV